MSIDIRMITHRVVDQLRYRVYTDRATMGVAAASYIEGLIVATLARQTAVRMIFSAAPSQDEVLASLAASDLIEWPRVHAFHMDEYIGLSSDAPQGFGQFLRTRLFGKVPLASVNYLDISASNPRKECERYGQLLAEDPIDICCLGVGENGHIAFNDPPVADFADTQAVKIVSLDEVCRQQQVNDGCFASLCEVPTQAMTLTIP
ncbi:MAG: 6-phosphogluconolactonase, partial [Thermoguttaceae bacterium]|nr:6-phosphogluconolactonase [Thermoguttaceae bacterium]